MKIDAEKEDFDDRRKSYSKKRDKKGGTTNTEKLRNKPFNMLLPKKVRAINDMRESNKKKIRKVKTQLGKFTRLTKQKIESRKKKK